jgi:hypothetical protein
MPHERPLLRALIALALIGLMACAPGTATPSPSSTAAAVSVAGTFVLTSDAVQWTGSLCRGTRGYSDIAEGAGVTVRDGKGEVIAVGSLRTDMSRSTVTHCTYTFSIEAPDVPFYAIEVSHRGSVTFSKADVAAGVALSLGD